MTKKIDKVTFPISSLVPEYWDIKVSTADEVVFLGEITIIEMLEYWKHKSFEYEGSANSLQEKIDLLKGKTAKKFLDLAKKYENPEFPEIGIRKDGWGQDPEPLDAASINRDSKTTTFNVCGWCEYASCGSCRYNYYINTNCSFLGYPSEEKKFNTPCFLPCASKETLDNVRTNLLVKRDKTLFDKKASDAKVKLLLSLKKRAEKKPALPAHRPCEWFDVDDPVICYLGNYAGKCISDLFVSAKVIYGYRHHDGCVSVCYDKKVHTGDYLEGRGGGFGCSRPEVMHKWEFDYLCEHPDFAKIYATTGTGKHISGHNSSDFISALKNEWADRCSKDSHVFTKRIKYCGEYTTVCCDGKCHKAWGINCRKTVGEDDSLFVRDDLLGCAPDDPGTYEGGQGKPDNPSKMNKWCTRECERSVLFDDSNAATFEALQTDYKRFGLI